MAGENGLYRLGVILWLLIFLIVHSTHSAPVYDEDTTQVAEYEGGTGCHYNFQDYEEGDRIMTNEPCLNCTCHNRMLMCYLRVCPQFTKAIGQNCKVEKRPDQCCPVITCPEVPVQLLTSTTSAPSDSTELGFHDNYGCSINNKFYADGAQLPTDPNNPCELCYCIRNRTTCTMQQCTLNIAQCDPVYHLGICCPVKYDCDYNEEVKTTPGTTPGLIMTTTIIPETVAPRCFYKGKMFNDGDLLYSTEACHHCYCFRGDIACAIQDCGKPMETHGKNCTALAPPEGECCPTTYECENTNEPIEGEDQQKVTYDENDIIATQPTLPIQKVDEEQKYEDEEFPGANNAISQDNQVHEEITIKSIETVTTTEPTESTTEQENNQVPEKETPASGLEDNAVPQEPIVPVIHVDETTQSTDEFNKPTKPIDSIEAVEHTQSTTISNEVEATKTPAKESPENKPEVHTESSIAPSEKPSTNLPARSEDQFPLEQPTLQPEEILTNLPNSENKFSETAVTVPVITEPENNGQAEEMPVSHVFDTNEIPKIPKHDEEPKVEETPAPEEVTTIKAASEAEVTNSEEVDTEASITEMPETSKESKPQTELPTTELPEVVKEDQSTTYPSNISDITSKIPEQESATTEKLGEIPEDGATTHSIAEQPTSTHTVPITEIIESEITDIPTEGPSGIATGTRGPVNKADDNQSVPETQVPEGYEENVASEETQAPDHLMTDKPEAAIETSTGAPESEEEKLTEKPQISAEEPTAPVTEITTIEPEVQTPGEHIQRISPTPVEASTTEGPIVYGEQSTTIVESEKTPTTYSTEASEDEKPMKGLEVSGEQSSEETTLPGTSTEIDIQPDSSEDSLEEEGEKTNTPVTPIAPPTSTGFSTEAENEITTEKLVTELPMKKETIIPNDVSNEEKPIKEEETTEEILPAEEPTKEKPADETSTDMKLPEEVEETQTTEIQPLKTEEDQTTSHPEEASTAIVKEEISTSTFNESSSTSVPVEIEPAEVTENAEEITKPLVTSAPQESSTNNTDIDKTSEEGESQSTELPLPQENATEMEESVQPGIKEILEVKPQEAIKPTDEPVSMSEQSTTEFEKSDFIVNQQTELPTILENIEPTEAPVVEEKPAEGASSTPIDLAITEPTEQKQTTSLIIENQTIDAVSQLSITEENPTEKETLGEDDVQQTQTPLIISEGTETADTAEKSTESAIVEKEPIEKLATTTESDLKTEGTPTEAIIVAVTVPDTNELPGDTQSELKPEEPSSESAQITPSSEDHEKSTESPISDEQPISIATESSITDEKSTENTIASEITPISATEQQPNEEPVSISEIPVEKPTEKPIRTEYTISEENSSETSTSAPAESFKPEGTLTEASITNFTHTEEIPVELTEEPAVTSIPTKEPTFESTSEIPTESLATTIENKEPSKSDETPELPNKSVTEPSSINDETTIHSEPPKQSVSTEVTVEPAFVDEQTTPLDNQQTEKPKQDQEIKPIQGEIPPSVTTTSIPAIEKETTPTVLDEAETPVEEVKIVTDAPVAESSTEVPLKDEKPQVVSELIPSTTQQSEQPTDSPVQSIESTDKFSEEKLSSTETSEEILPTTTENLKPLGIPGEGNCLIDGDTYTNNSAIPPVNPCQISCRCVSSIVQCESVQCPPPPKHVSSCMPVLMRDETCCPMYTCDIVPTSSLEADNQMAEQHTTTEKEIQEQETKAPSTDEVSANETMTPEEVTKQSEEPVTLLHDQKESTSVTPAESSSTAESTIGVIVEEPLNITPETASESTEHTESPVIITKESIPEIEITSTALPTDGVESTESIESDTKNTVPAIDNRVSEQENVTTSGEEVTMTIKPISDSHTPKGEEVEAVTVVSTDKHSVTTPDDTQTESGIVSTEAINEPSISTEVHDEISTNTSDSDTSTEAQTISTIGEENSVMKESPTTTIAERPVENIEETSEKSQEGTSSSEHPSELTSMSSVTELSTEIPATEKNEISLPETNKPHDDVSSSGENQTTESVSSEIKTTISPIVKETEIKPSDETLPVSDTNVPPVTEEHKEDVSEKPIEIPKTEIPEEQEMTIIPVDEETAVPTVHQEQPISEENTTADAISEGTTEPSIISEEQENKSTETPESLEAATESSVVEDASASTEPVASSEAASSSMSPTTSEQTKPAITEIYEEETVKPFSSDLTEIPSSEIDLPTTPSIMEEAVTATSAIEVSKPEEAHTLSSVLPSVTETEQLFEEKAETTSPSTETSMSDSQSVKTETEKSPELTTPLATVVPVESELSTEKYQTETPEKSTEGITSITSTPGIEISVTEAAIASNETSEIPVTAEEHLSEEPITSQPSPTEEILPEHVDVSVDVTEKIEEASKSPVEVETSSISVSSESSPAPEIPSEEHLLPTEAPAETATEPSNKEASTEIAAETTKSPATPSVFSDTTEHKPVSEEKPTEISVEEEKEVTTEIKSETPIPMEEASTAEPTKETESPETISPIEHTPSTVLPTIIESSTQAEEISPTTSAHEQPTIIMTDVPEKSTNTPAIVSSTNETVTVPIIEELPTQSPIESTDEHTVTPVKSEIPQENPVTETRPVEEPEQTTDAHKPAEHSPLEPIEDDIQHQIPDPSVTFEHSENEGQLTINPLEHEIVQEHITEAEKNLTSLDHGYVPPSTTEASIGGEYPEQSVSGEDNPHFPINGGTHLNPEEDYDEDDQAVYGPGTCRYSGKVYVSAQQIPRDDPCDFCFCFRGDIICLQQSCPPPIPGCHEEPINGFCCPRYECPVSMATSLNITTTTTTTTTTLPPHFLSHSYKGATRRSGCQIKGQAYKVGEFIHSASGPCLHCICGGDGNMKCEPRICTPEPMIRQMIAAATAKRRR